MVNVANDPALPEGDLPAANRPRGAEPEASGISLRLITGLAATAHGVVHGDGPRLDVSVDSTTPPCRAALREAAAGASLTHRLVLADAAALAASLTPMSLTSATAATRSTRVVARLDTAGVAGARRLGPRRGVGRRSRGRRGVDRAAAHRRAARAPRDLHDGGAQRDPRAPDGDPAPARGRRPGARADRARRRLARRPLRAGRRLPRRRGDGDDHRRTGHRAGRVAARARARDRPALLRPQRPAAHRGRADGPAPGRSGRRARRRPHRRGPPRPRHPHRLLQPTPPHRRRRAPARASSDGGGPRDHEGPGGLGRREQVPRGVPPRRPRRSGRLGRARRRPCELPRLGHRPPDGRRRRRDRRGRRPVAARRRGGPLPPAALRPRVDARGGCPRPAVPRHGVQP